MNQSTTAFAIDPVCGMTVRPEQAVGSSSYNGDTYYFCSRGCETKFDAAPAEYVGARTAPAEASSCCSTGHSCC